MTNRAWFRVHSWLGVMSGLLLFVICWSGTVATLSHEIDWLVNPALRVEPRSDRAAWSDMVAAVQAAVPNGTVSRLNEQRGPRWAAEAWVQAPDDRSLRVYVDPYTARVQGVTSYFNVERFFRSFHMMLFLPYPAGAYLVTAFGFLLLTSMAAALVFYKRWWQRFLEVRAHRSGRVRWSELHKAGGLWSLWFVLLIGITGVWYFVEQFGTDLVDPDFAYPAPPELARASAVDLPLDELVQRGLALRPDLRLGGIGFPAGASAGLLYMDGQAGHVLVRDRANKLYLDMADGSMVLNQSAADLNALERWIETADPLHFGNFGGLLTKIIWFVFGLLLSALCLTGAYLHAQRLAREAGALGRARWHGTFAAVGTTSAILIGSMYYGAHELRDYGPLVNGLRELPDVPLGVTLFLAGWLLVTIGAVVWWIWLLRRRAAPASMRMASGAVT